MTRRRADVLFAIACLAALLVAYLVRDTRGFELPDETGQYQGDITHYVYWTRLVTLGGIQAAYGGTWPETYAVYPPVTLYAYQAVGTAYRALVDPTFDPVAAQQSDWLLHAIKAVAVGWHLLAGLAIYLLLRRVVEPSRAALGGILYVLNPAALYDVAHWAQPDGAHSLFSVLAVGLLEMGAVGLAWAAMALAALAKPQAWAILPLLTLATWRESGLGRLVRGALVGAGVAVVVLLPFLVTGRLGQFLSLPGTISSVMPSVTADAHNAWWLYYAWRGTDPLFSADTARFVGPLSFRAVAGLLVGAQFLFGYWLYWTRRAGLAEAAALGALGWFVFTTQAHENHLFFALPLLSLAWPRRPKLLVPFAVVTLTVLLNMALQDQPLLAALGFDLYDPVVQALRTANAVLNLACFASWSLWALLRPAGSAEQVRAVDSPFRRLVDVRGVRRRRDAARSA